MCVSFLLLLFVVLTLIRLFYIPSLEILYLSTLLHSPYTMASFKRMNTRGSSRLPWRVFTPFILIYTRRIGIKEMLFPLFFSRLRRCSSLDKASDVEGLHLDGLLPAYINAKRSSLLYVYIIVHLQCIRKYRRRFYKVRIKWNKTRNKKEKAMGMETDCAEEKNVLAPSAGYA